MSTSRGTKRSREDDDDQQQAKADLRLRCTLPGQNYAKFHSSDTNARDLIYRTAGHDAQLADAPPAETAVVWCGDMNDGLNSAKVRFNLDLATQYPSIFLEDPTISNQGIQVYGQALLKRFVNGEHLTGLKIEITDGSNVVSAQLHPELRGSWHPTRALVHIKLLLQPLARYTARGYESQTENAIDELVQVLTQTQAKTESELNIQVLYGPRPGRTNDRIEHVLQSIFFKQFRPAMLLAAYHGHNWYLRGHEAYDTAANGQQLRRFDSIDDPECLSRYLQPPYWLAQINNTVPSPYFPTERDAGSWSSFASQDSLFDLQHLQDQNLYAVFRERECCIATVVDIYAMSSSEHSRDRRHTAIFSSARGGVQAQVAPQSCRILVKLAKPIDEKNPIRPTPGQQVDIVVVPGQKFRASVVVSLDEEDCDVTFFSTGTSGLDQVQRDTVLTLHAIQPVTDTTTFKHQVKAIRNLTRAAPDNTDIALNVVQFLLNQVRSSRTFRMASEGDQHNGELAEQLALYKGILDEFQFEALSSSLESSGGVTLVQGPPGTGKSSVIVAMTKCAMICRQKVLIAAPSNVAVDELLSKLLGNVETGYATIVRITSDFNDKAQHRAWLKLVDAEGEGAEAAALSLTTGILSGLLDIDRAASLRHESKAYTLQAMKLRMLKEYADRENNEISPRHKAVIENWQNATDTFAASHNGKLTSRLVKHVVAMDEALTQYILEDRCHVVLVTLNMAGKDELVKYFKPSICIIDEAGQATEPDIIIPLSMHAKSLRSICLVGDQNQLSPFTASKARNEAHDHLALGTFSRVVKLGYSRTVMLKTCYRYGPDHGKFISKQFYNDSLVFRANVVRPPLESAVMNWFLTKYGVDAKTSRIALDVGDKARSETYRGGTSRVNYVEADALVATAIHLVHDRVCQEQDILVLTPYSAQTMMIAEKLKAYTGIRVKTITQSQGGEAPVVLSSWVLNDVAKKMYWITDPKKMCVGLSRQQNIGIMFSSWGAHRARAHTDKDLQPADRVVGLFQDPMTKSFGALWYDLFAGNHNEIFKLPTGLRTPSESTVDG